MVFLHLLDRLRAAPNSNNDTIEWNGTDCRARIVFIPLLMCNYNIKTQSVSIISSRRLRFFSNEPIDRDNIAFVLVFFY